jgi:hypothetical protein
LPASFDAFKERTFTKDALRWNPWGKGEVPFFLEVWPFLRNYWRTAVRFSKEPPHRFAYMQPDGPLKIYLTAVFGVFADNDEGKKVLIEHFGAKLVTYDKEFRKAPKQELIFPISATQFIMPSYFLRAASASWWRESSSRKLLVLQDRLSEVEHLQCERKPRVRSQAEAFRPRYPRV